MASVIAQPEHFNPFLNRKTTHLDMSDAAFLPGSYILFFINPSLLFVEQRIASEQFTVCSENLRCDISPIGN